MKKFKPFSTLLAAGALFLGLCSAAAAQSSFENNHFEAGVFADYMNFSQSEPRINFVGLGARIGVNVHPHVALEAEMNYDFERNHTDIFDNGGTTTFVRSNLRSLTALFGPKFQVGTRGPVRAFATGKVGFINFSRSNQSAGSGFIDSLSGISDGDTKVAFYPGVGVEGFLGPIGLRLDVGDEIYWNNGTNNNLKVEFGPHIRF